MTTPETRNVTTIGTELDGNCNESSDAFPSPCDSEQDWYNATSCECQALSREVLTFQDPPGVAFLAVAVLSTLLDLGVVLVFVRHRHTPIVKASNRELSFLLLFVLLGCFCFPVLQVGTAEPWRCLATTLQGPVTTCVYAIFLVKTHRVLSIFEARIPKVVHRQWILGRSLQLVGVFVLTLLQVVISAVYVSILRPAVVYVHDPELRVTYAQCKDDGPINIVNSAYPILLMVLCLCFAFRARRLPENYGESRHILATMAVSFAAYTTCFGVSVALLGVTKTIVLNVSLSFTPLAQLVLLFFPKVYIILVCPERNTVQELRRMTLAHMQRQSEFSPTEAGESKRQSQAQGRRRSLRSSGSKIHGVPSSAVEALAQASSQNGSTARCAAAASAARKKSVHTMENGSAELGKNGLQRDAGRPHRGSARTGPGEVEAEDWVSTDVADPGLARQHRSGGGAMRRQSSGLFVIQFLEKVPESEGEDSQAARSLDDGPVKFSLRETEPEEGAEGDMFVVSVLGKTLTLTVEDRKTGVPEMLGGVYVGSKTVPISGGALKGPHRPAEATSAPTHTNGEHSPEEAQEGGERVGNSGAVETPDCGGGGHGTKDPSQDAGGVNVGNGEEPAACVNREGAVMQDSVTDTECHVEAPNKTRDSGDRDFETEGDFQDPREASPTESSAALLGNATEDCTNSSSILHPECTEKIRLEDDTVQVSLASGEDLSPASSVDEKGNHRTVDADVPSVNRSPPPARDSKPPVSEDAVSVGSSSSNSTFCETAADDKRRLLGGTSPAGESGAFNAVDMSDIFVHMNGN